MTSKEADSEVCAAKDQYTSVAELVLFLELNYSRTESLPFNLTSSVSVWETSKPELKARFRKASMEPCPHSQIPQPYSMHLIFF